MTTDAQLALDDALERARDHADAQWMLDAQEAVLVVAKRDDLFTTDEVWEWLEMFSTHTTHDPRAMGAVMRWAVQARICQPTQTYRNSTRPACHKRPVRVWEPTLQAMHDTIRLYAA